MSLTYRRLSLSVCLAAVLVAGPAIAGFSIVGPSEPKSPAIGFETGTWVSASVPTGPARDAFSHGISTGVTFTSMQNRHVGIGVDLAYSRWLSPQAGAALDALFGALSGVPISGTKATLTGLQVVGHVKVVALPARRITPWAQLGGGVCRTNNKLELPADQLRAAGWTILDQSTDGIGYSPVVTSGIGLDFKIDHGMKLGLDATYQKLWISHESETFTTFTIGGHVLLSRW